MSDRSVSRAWVNGQPWLSTVVRLGLAFIWLYAGYTKVTDLSFNVRAVQAYQLLPSGVAQVIGAGQPFLEIALGLLLLVGLGVRASAVLSGLLLIVYIAGIISAAARGLQIDCGCFSQGGTLAAGQATHYARDILRDIGFLAMSVYLVWWPRSRFALDAVLFPPLDLD